MKNNVKDSSKLFLIACIFMILCGAFSAVGGVKTVLFAYGDTNHYIRLLSMLQSGIIGEIRDVEAAFTRILPGWDTRELTDPVNGGSQVHFIIGQEF